MHPEAEAGVPVALAVELDLVRVLEHRGVPVGHRPRQPEPVALLELHAVDLLVLGHRAPVAGGRGVEAQELLGGAVAQLLPLGDQPLPLVGVLAQPLQRVRGQRRRRVEAAADEQAHRAQHRHVVGLRAADVGVDEGVDQARPGVGADVGDVAERPHAHDLHLLVDDLLLGRARLGVDLRVDRLHVGHVVVHREAEHRHRQHRGDDVGQVVDEVDPAGLDHLVDRGAGDLVDDRLPAGDRRRGQVRVERVAVVPLRRRVHAQEHAAEPAGRAVLQLADLQRRRRDRDPGVAVALAVRVVVVGQHVGPAGGVEQLLVAADEPVAAVGVVPRDRLAGVQLVGQPLELGPVLVAVPVELDAQRAAVPCGAVVGADAVVDGHAVSPGVGSVG